MYSFQRTTCVLKITTAKMIEHISNDSNESTTNDTELSLHSSKSNKYSVFLSESNFSDLMMRSIIFNASFFASVWMLNELLKKDNIKANEHDKRISKLVIRLSIILLFFAILICICLFLKLRIGAALASGTVLVGFFSFAIKDNLGDLLSGIILLASKKISVGDRVRILISSFSKVDDQKHLTELNSDIVVSDLNLFMLEGFYTKDPTTKISIRYSMIKGLENV